MKEKDPLEYFVDELKKSNSKLANMKWEYRVSQEYVASPDFKSQQEAKEYLDTVQKILPQLQGGYVGIDLKRGDRFWVMIPTKSITALSDEIKEPSSSKSETGKSIFKQKPEVKEEKAKRPPDIPRPSGLGPKK